MDKTRLTGVSACGMPVRDIFRCFRFWSGIVFVISFTASHEQFYDCVSVEGRADTLETLPGQSPAVKDATGFSLFANDIYT